MAHCPDKTAQSDDQGATLALETIAGLVERNAVLSDRVAALEREAGRATASADLLAAQLAESQATLARERVVSEVTLARERSERDEIQRRLTDAEERTRRPWWRRW